MLLTGHRSQRTLPDSRWGALGCSRGTCCGRRCTRRWPWGSRGRRRLIWWRRTRQRRSSLQTGKGAHSSFLHTAGLQRTPDAAWHVQRRSRGSRSSSFHTTKMEFKKLSVYVSVWTICIFFCCIGWKTINSSLRAYCLFTIFKAQNQYGIWNCKKERTLSNPQDFIGSKE